MKTETISPSRELGDDELNQAGGGLLPAVMPVAHNPPGDIVLHNPPGLIPPDPYVIGRN